MKENKHLLLFSSLGVLLLLLGAAFEEMVLKDWRRIQGRARSDEGAVTVQLRQIVNASLGVSDRCVSCHVSMGPGEQGVRGDKILVAHKPVVHDPAEYGCTVCHGGQGQATDKEDAHGKVHFWPSPMLGRETSYAGCGRCHATLRVPEQEQMRNAELAFERLDCLTCHRVEGRGGTIRPGGGGMEGPELSRAGLKGYDGAWYGKHEKKSAEAAAGPWKGAFSRVPADDQGLLKIYLDTRVAASRLVTAKSVFFSYGCLGCHKVSGVGGDDGPDLSRAGEKDPGQVSFKYVPGEATMENWMAAHFRSPVSVVAGSQMPPENISTQQLNQLTLFTLSLRRDELRDQYLPKDRARAVKFGEREFATDGATLFGAFCAGCHGQDGQGRRLPGLMSFPSITNADFLALAPDEFLARTVREGRPGRKMPGWLKEGGLRQEEIQAVVAHVRTLGGPAEASTKPARWVSGDAAQGRRIFESACSGCHGKQAKGGEGPALNNKVLLESATDSYLVETVSRGRRGTAMASFLEPSPVRGALSRAEIEAVVAYLRSLQGGKS
ncbi:MAG: c-type cytochrome [Candidatus Solibacter usitatus]|nr:c-type cytochrome [Candidatus Solibacter usitatus]